jgi:hypothetical protein
MKIWLMHTPATLMAKHDDSEQYHVEIGQRHKHNTRSGKACALKDRSSVLRQLPLRASAVMRQALQVLSGAFHHSRDLQAHGKQMAA